MRLADLPFAIVFAAELFGAQPAARCCPLLRMAPDAANAAARGGG